jgi:hypothetical protein
VRAIYFQETGEVRADFDLQMVAMAIRAAIDGVAPRLARYPGLDVAYHTHELASLFVRAIRAEDGHPRETHEKPKAS